MAWVPTWQPSFEVGVIAFGIGIALYFAWPTEPSLIVLLTIAVLLCGLSIFSTVEIRGYCALLFIGALGLTWSAAHTRVVTPNPLDYEQRLSMEGWVVDIDDGGRMRRLIIATERVEPIPEAGPPKEVRVRVGKAYSDVSIGDPIGLNAVLSPLPGPVVPNGYDPARRAFYDGLAGSGFAISRFDPQLETPSLITRFRIKIGQVRVTIAERVLSVAPEPTNGLQAALLTGIRHHIPPEQTENLRASGLAHVLAISGLHMGLVAFGIYLASSYLLAAIGPIARSRDVRKHAAVIGIIMATIYLLLSGASVATQRAYIMVCIAFMAIILNRRAISIRSVAVAAIVT
ncbi:MAG: ComEC/Rec2 family competence protein, partial [Pseudomonadota bacterium]